MLVDVSSFFPLFLFFLSIAEEGNDAINEDWIRDRTSDQLLLA
jgi:hypothetical protein